MSLSRQIAMLEQTNKLGVRMRPVRVLVECEYPIPPHFRFFSLRLARERAKQITLGPFCLLFYPTHTTSVRLRAVTSGRDTTGFGVRGDPLHCYRVPRLDEARNWD